MPDIFPHSVTVSSNTLSAVLPAFNKEQTPLNIVESIYKEASIGLCRGLALLCHIFLKARQQALLVVVTMLSFHFN